MPESLRHLVTLGATAGRLIASYEPTGGTVSLTAYVSNDKRRLPIGITTTPAALRDLLEKIEDTIAEESRAREAPAAIAACAEGVTVTVLGAQSVVPWPIYNRVIELMKEGENDTALYVIRHNFKALSESGASDMATQINRHLRPLG